jgi:hypothetical protein
MRKLCDIQVELDEAIKQSLATFDKTYEWPNKYSIKVVKLREEMETIKKHYEKENQ